MIKAIAVSYQNGFTHTLCKPCSRWVDAPARPGWHLHCMATITDSRHSITVTACPSTPSGVPLQTNQRLSTARCVIINTNKTWMVTMDRQSVRSKNLSSVGYDEETSILEIGFNSGFVYQYFGVPYHIYDGLLFAGSKGEFFDRYIRKGRYNYRQMW